MAKRPLRAWMRDKLLNHAKEAVAPAAEKRALGSAYAKAAPLVAAIIEKKFPVRDMKVLQRYNCVAEHADFRIQSPDGALIEFTFGKDDTPTTPSNCSYRPIFLGDARTYAAILTWDQAKTAYEKERTKRIEAFQTLVMSVSFVEDVFDVWPEAAKLIPAREMTARLAPEQIAIIKADMRERKLAAAA